MTDIQVMLQLAQGATPPRPSPAPLLTDEYWEFIQRCWAADPSAGPTAQDVFVRVSSFFSAASEGVTTLSAPPFQELEPSISLGSELTSEMLTVASTNEDLKVQAPIPPEDKIPSAEMIQDQVSREFEYCTLPSLYI